MLQDYTSLPVVEVKISVYAMLRSLKLAENYQHGYAIVGFENITESAHVLCDLLQKSMKIITLRSRGEVETVLAGLRAEGCRLVICDMVTYHHALELGLDAYLITSGVESVREALAEAETRGSRFHRLREKISLREAIISGSETKPFVLSREGKLLYPQEGSHPDEEMTYGSDDVIIIDKNLKGVDFQLAKCCHPIYGDNVFGFVTINGGIKIHRIDCPNAPELRKRFGYRIVRAKWSGKGQVQYSTTLRIIGNDDIGIVNNITSIISKEEKIVMRSINIDSHDGLFSGNLVVNIEDTSKLDALIKKLRTVKGVKQVVRL